MISIAYIIIGLLLILCGVIGACNSVLYRRSLHSRRKCSQLAYQCLLMLVTLICLVLFVVNSIGLSMASRQTIYDNLMWAEIVQSQPSYSCKTEKRLGCAGYQKSQCQFDSNETSNSYCPGHFCVDFCKIATDDINTQALCRPCRTNELTPTEFLSCKMHEKLRSPKVGCELPLNEDLRMAYQRLLVVALLCFLWASVTVIASSYQLCCL